MKWGPNAVLFRLEFNWDKTAVLPVRAGGFRTGRKMRRSLAVQKFPFRVMTPGSPFYFSEMAFLTSSLTDSGVLMPQECCEDR